MTAGNKEKLAIEFKKISDEDHVSEIYLYIHGNNICEWNYVDSKNRRTTRWNLDDLVEYLYSTLDFTFHDEPFPIDGILGECAIQLDNKARDFDSDNEEEMDEYYSKLNDWTYAHSWHHESAGAVLADVMFRKVDNAIEVSYWNDSMPEGVEENIHYTYTYGFITIPIEEYRQIITEALNEYNSMWK